MADTFPPRGLLGLQRGAASLLSPGQPEERPESPLPDNGGFWGRFAQVFAGPPDPNLTPEQNRQARNQALMRAGLSMVLSSGPRPVSPGTAQIFAEGALAGQEAGALMRSGIARQNELEQIQTAFGGGEIDRDRLQALAMRFIMSGDMEAAQRVTELLRSLPEDAGHDFNQAMAVTGPDGVVRLVHPRTGETIRTFGEGKDPDAPVPFKDLIPSPAPDGGTQYRHPDTGEVELHVPQGVTAYQSMQMQSQAVTQLGSQYNAVTRPHFEVADAYARALGAAKEQSVSGDIGILMNVMRMINPAIRVRPDSELPLEEAGGIPDQLRALFNRTVRGRERISPSTRAETLRTARNLAEAQRRQLSVINRQWSHQLQSFGIPADRVVNDPFEDLLGPDAPAPTPPGDGDNPFDHLIPGGGR